MRIQQLKYIIKIVETGSMNEASKHLFVTQPSLSNAVRELEEEMGIKIFTRSTRGITLTSDGAEFLAYARQIVEQTELLEERYKYKRDKKELFAVSAQHYAFVVESFASILRENDMRNYELILRETRTHEVIDDVRDFRSEIGVLYLNDFNRDVLTKLFADNNIAFTSLFTTSPHVFISKHHPLAAYESVSLDDMVAFPYLSYEQGERNSFYFSEEILSTARHDKSIVVSDRATLFNLLIGLDGYTISTGILNSDLNGDDIISVPLHVDETIEIGYIRHKKGLLSELGERFLKELEDKAKI
ncbi:LysR family transcriptional regulator [Lactococcus hodotermopsidis]|uniref:LysR family transcriptional regulator n=1 Tax=Pseudolactococcus hodotermopsidis TaxID=2709157 RepID=A0A6A0BEB1_9LACT|nr:LysR family transcriptional regulator [Lactococcus hodotermopsidis]GFH42668.1 LysR family transcriptional regulator [Lactococcus hodotermopsidis]